MTARVQYRAEAFADIAEAFSWYQQRRAGLGWEFHAELEATLEMLREAPEAAPIVYRNLRRALLRRFPYAVYYTLGTDVIDVRAVAHTSRHPAHWRRRV